MTLAEMRTDVYELLGEPTDLDPDVSTTRLDFAINQGVKKIAMWKEPGMGQVRFRDLFRTTYFKANVKTETLISGSTVNTLILDSTAPDYDNAYLSWVVEVNNEFMLVVGYTGASRTVLLSSSLSSAPASALEATFYQSHFRVLPTSSLLSSLNISKPEGYIETLKIVDLEQGQELNEVDRVEAFVGNLTSVGDPTEFYRFGDEIIFNSAPEEERYFKMEYYRVPPELVNADDEPAIPQMFHYAVVLWAVWWGYKRAQESSAAYSTKRDLIDFMRTTKGEYDIYNERSNGHGYLRRGR